MRWHGTDRASVTNPRAFLMTTTTRICLDMMKSARARREEYVGPWLPEPVLDTAALAPDSRAELAEDLSIALLLTLDRLSASSGRPSCCTMCSISRSRKWPRRWNGARWPAAGLPPAPAPIARRPAARHHRAGDAPRRDRSEHAQLISAFIAAARSGDLRALTRLLASDARVWSDGGGKVPAAQGVIEGADRVAQFAIDAARPGPGQEWNKDFTKRLATINGLPGVIVGGTPGTSADGSVRD